MKIIPAIAMILILSGCGTVSQSQEGQLVIQYATAKLIRETDYTGENIVSFIDRIRPLAENEEGPLMIVLESIRAEIPWQDLYPEDRIIVNYIFDTAAERLYERSEGGVNVPADVMAVLDWIEQAAILTIR